MSKSPRTTNPECSLSGNLLVPQPCEGSLWESKRYFTSGASSYLCEKHALASMTMNPPALGGPRYVPCEVTT